MILVLQKEGRIYYSIELWDEVYVFERSNPEETVEKVEGIDSFDLLDWITTDDELDYRLKGIVYGKFY